MSKAKKQKPTAKKARTARGISKHENVPLEPWVLQDVQACNQFIDYYQNTLPPTLDQLEMLAKFETGTGLVPVVEISERAYLTFLWNCAMEHVVYVVKNPRFDYDEERDEEMPTGPMHAFAESLASETATYMPERVLEEKSCCHAFIGHCLNHRRPTKRMLQSEDRLSVLLGIESDPLIRKSKDATKYWIRILRRIHDFRQGAGRVLPTLES